MVHVLVPLAPPDLTVFHKLQPPLAIVYLPDLWRQLSTFFSPKIFPKSPGLDYLTTRGNIILFLIF